MVLKEITEEEIESDVWKPVNVDDSIEGVLVSKDKSASYSTGAYTIETANGMKLFFGTYILDKLMFRVNVGQKIKVVYRGIELTKSNKPMKKFKVFVDDGQPAVEKINPQ